MAIIVYSFLTVFTAALGVLVGLLLVEIAAAVFLPQAPPPELRRPRQQRIAVLVPAHDEGSGILPTLADIKSQLRPGDRLLVVADNCSDDTATVAAKGGAEVVVRTDPTRVGKGYALQFGISCLALDPPEVAIVVDADCRLSDHCLDHLTITCAEARRPVQALDLMTEPNSSPIDHRIAEFAWRVKNWVRPLGLKALNLPCHLLGTGMAFPWNLICGSNLANNSLVEDVKLGLDLAVAGTAPMFCPSAIVSSCFPLTTQGADTQRKRWEHGHLHLISTVVPRLTYSALRNRNVHLFVLALDIAVPPLSILLGVLFIVFIVTLLAALIGLGWIPLVFSTADLLSFVTGVLLAWSKYARDLIRPSSIFPIARYFVAKLPLYYEFISRRAVSHWIRTDRTGVE